jgi:hypothetical protein
MKSSSPYDHLYEKHDNCTNDYCHICDGGLAVCLICGCAEASLPKHCPGVKINEEVQARIMAGDLDFRDNEWVVTNKGKHSLRAKKCSEHYHKDPEGKLVKCYHSCKSVLTSTAFWFTTTISFPLEHFLWEKVPPFKYLASLLGL